MKRILPILFLLTVFLTSGVKAALAGPHFSWSPATGSYDNGATFSVTLKIDSGSEKVLGVDVVGSFDKSKLELVSIQTVSDKAFNYDSNITPFIYNDDGTFEVTVSPTNMLPAAATVAVGDLLTFNFKAKTTGTALVSMTCQSNSTIETNIMNDSSLDVVDCASNGTGSYSISDGGGGTTADPTATPTIATTTTTTTTSSGELPQTGVVETTIGLMMFGVISVLGAVFLKFL